MIRPATVIVTVAVLLACPLICLGHAPGEQRFVPGAGCCPHCPAPLPDEGDEAPPQPVPSCCLCKGAITDRPAVDWQPDDHATAITVELGPGRLIIHGSAAEGQRLVESPLPHTGRMLRLEHCALTC